jgi:pimeloyl-ACP methyl ester carboxylesterase
MLDALSPQRRRLLLGVAGLILLLVIALVITIAVRALAPTPDPVPQDQPGPVLLVPGYGGRIESLDPLAAALRASGRTVIVVQPVGGNTGDLRTEAEHLADVADRALESGAPSVDVVGYSAGGVVARLWVRDEGGAAVARRVLTLGSPQHGTSQAALGAELAGGCPTACEQLVPDSDLLRRLNAGDETPDGPQWATVRSTYDRVVTPVESAALDGAVNILVQDRCPTSTAAHGALPGDPVTLAALGSVLGVAPPSPPVDVQC